MKLELKHLVGYLPYGLGIRYKIIGKFSSTRNEILEGRHLDNLNIYTFCKPILRPLSDLTKEIEVDGEKFVPINLLKKEFNKTLCPYLFFDGTISLDIDTENYSQTIDLFEGYLITQKLLEWHFDIYGLIENNLAIDINTLQL